MANTSQDARLKKLLAENEARLDEARSKNDLLKVIHEFASYNGPLKFTHEHAWWLLGAGLLLIFSIFGIAWGVDAHVLPPLRLWFPIDFHLFIPGALLFGSVFIIWSLLWIKSQSDRLPSLSNKIAWLSSCFDNGLTRLQEDPRYTLNRLDGQFSDYRRGNYSREVAQSLRGVFTGTLRNIAYEYHRLHYVDKRVVESRVSDGKGGTKTQRRVVYDHYDRYSLVIDFPWVTGISVRSDRQSQNDFPCSMDTASPDFNKAFCLTGRSEMLCAKFIKPTTVLHLLKLFNILERPNLEFSNSGKLCLSFASNDLLAFATQYSLTSPNEFTEEISAGIALPRLMSALQWSHALSELHDDNFAFTPQTIRQEK